MLEREAARRAAADAATLPAQVYGMHATGLFAVDGGAILAEGCEVRRRSVHSFVFMSAHAEMEGRPPRAVGWLSNPNRWMQVWNSCEKHGISAQGKGSMVTMHGGEVRLRLNSSDAA